MARTVTLAGGERVPYPEPSSAAATKVGVGNRRTDTVPEVAVRSLLHRSGLRFRKDRLVVAGEIRVRPDIVFAVERVAVFIDGCFWHSCPKHGRTPKANIGYWQPKLRANIERDRRVNLALEASGWLVVRAWEHLGPLTTADLVAAAVAGRRAGRLRTDVTASP